MNRKPGKDEGEKKKLNANKAKPSVFAVGQEFTEKGNDTVGMRILDAANRSKVKVEMWWDGFRTRAELSDESIKSLWRAVKV